MKHLAYPFSVEILVPNIEQKINPKDDILKEMYGPDISRKWLFDEDVEYAEWQLREGKKLMEKKWAKQFAKALLKTANEVEDTIIEENDNIESEINVDDLPTIIWNDTQYSVLLNDDGTAEIINEFGNTVITLDDVYTIDQVNEQLSDQEVVVEKDVSDETDELIKESKKLLKRFIKASNELEGILNKAQQYAHIDGFKNDFDAAMEDFNHIINNINATQNKIKQDNSLDITQRKTKYYISLNEDDKYLFKQNICPMCNGDDFTILSQSDNEWRIQCNQCDTIYIIDPKTGQIGVDDNE